MLKRFGIFTAAAAVLGVAAVLSHGHATAVAAGANGADIYTAKCASCHQANGEGLTGAFPPLAKNAVVTGDPKKVIAIVSNGLNGPVTVGGKTYSGAMPAWKGQLKNDEIAAVVTYIRQSWGNKASAVTAAQVK